MKPSLLGKALFVLPVSLFIGGALFLWSIILAKFLGLLDGEVLKFLSWEWDPSSQNFGIFPMMISSLSLASLATVFAFSWSFGLAVFLQGVGPRFLRNVVAFLIRAMASIPSIIFGLAGALYVVPLIRQYSHGSGYSLLATICTLSFFLLPFQTKLCSSAFAAAEERIGISADVLGFTKLQKIFWIVVPEAKIALYATLAMGFCRSLGDTMIALLVSGNSPQVPGSLFAPVRVLTAHIALVASTDSFSPIFDSLFVAVAFLLSFTVGTTFLSGRILQRQRV